MDAEVGAVTNGKFAVGSTAKFGIKDKIGYMFGDFGNDFTFIFSSMFLMVFYTKVMGVGAGMVGTMFLVCRIIDAFTDVAMGRIVDTVKPAKDGRFRPWIRRMAAPVAIASFLCYQSGLADMSYTFKVVYMFATYILWGSIFYTSINIPYGSMASAISPEAADRAALSTFRSLGASLAGLVIGVGAPLIIYSSDAQGNKIIEGGRFTLIAGIFSVLAIVCYLLAYFLTTERVKVAPATAQKTEKVSAGATIKAIFTNRALLGIIVSAIFLLLAMLLTQTMNQYLFADYFKNIKALSTISFLGMLPTFILAPFAVKITSKFGKKESAIVAMLVAAAAYILLFFMKVQNAYVFTAISFIVNLGMGWFNLIIWANITDVIDYQEIKTGKREDGTVYAVYSFSRKLGQALAGGLGGWVLAFIGYNSKVKVQPESVTTGIYNAATLIPGLCFLVVALALAFIYPLTKKKVLANIETLKERHNA